MNRSRPSSSYKTLSHRPWPLHLKLGTAMLAAVLIVGVFSNFLDSRYLQSHISNELKDQSYRTLQLVSAGALEAIIVEDVALLSTLVDETALKEQDLASLFITNESSQTMARWNSPGFSKLSNFYEYKHPIELEGELFGTVHAFWNPARLKNQVDERLAHVRRTMLFSLFGLTALCLFLYQILVASPLGKLSNGLKSMSIGEPVEPLKITSSREMAMLGDAVNDLVASISESTLLAEELTYQATHDQLTGLNNRHAFETNLRQHLKNRETDSPEDTLLYFDLDQFKVVNDTCGHAAGDALLCQLSAKLSRLIEEGHIFARLGGDEFAVLMPGVPLAEGSKKAEALRESAQDFRFSYEGRSFIVEVSIGVVCIDGEDEKLERLMTAVDEACYAAKDAGRNRVQVYQEDDNALQIRRGEMNWIPRIHDALENSRLVLFGQIIAPTKKLSEKESHIEVLVRMRSKDGELIPPGAFLPAAERYGIMPHIDRWVICNTLQWMENELTTTNSVPRCAINISAMSMSDDKFRQFLLDELSNTFVPCTNICFEMTETAAVADLSTAMEFMTTVKSSGCQFALDDFGSGMSSFMYLKNLPVDFVKIDGAFVSPLMSDQISVVMVRAIADIAREMDIQTIAEFVENDDIRNKLEEIEIDYVQGYGVGKPKPLTEFSYQTKSIDKAA